MQNWEHITVTNKDTVFISLNITMHYIFILELFPRKWENQLSFSNWHTLYFRDTFSWEIPCISQATNSTLWNWRCKAVQPRCHGTLLSPSCTWLVWWFASTDQKWWKRKNFETERGNSKATSGCNVASVVLFPKSSKLVMDSWPKSCYSYMWASGFNMTCVNCLLPWDVLGSRSLL